MDSPHDHLRHILAGDMLGGGRYTWRHVVGVLQRVREDGSEASHLVLREAAVFTGRLALDESQGLPHSMSPEDFLRWVAVQTLGAWDATRHRDVIARAAGLMEHEHLAVQARRLLA